MYYHVYLFIFFLRLLPSPRPTLFPTRRSSDLYMTNDASQPEAAATKTHIYFLLDRTGSMEPMAADVIGGFNQFLHEQQRSEEHTSELQSLRHLVCRLPLEKKKKICNVDRRTA